MDNQIVDFNGLAEFLACSKSILSRQWRYFPKVTVGYGQTARSARFNTAEVWAYLREIDEEKKAYYHFR